MTPQAKPGRRDFLALLGGGSVGAAALGSLACSDRAVSAPAVEDVRSEYLFEAGLIYLQTASLGPCPRVVVDAAMLAWSQLESNPTPMAYRQGDTTLSSAESVRDLAATFFGCDREEVAITRSTTDGMNAVAQGIRWRPGDRVLTSDQEHEGGSSCWDYVSGREGLQIDTVAIPPDLHDPAAIVDRFAARMTPRTRVISVSHVLSSTGLRMPIPELSALARSRDALCVVDGAQSAGSIAFNVKTLGCHAYATSGHKWLLGPKGTGLLYVSTDVEDRIKPIQFHESRAYYNHSSGVGNLPGVVGLGAALRLLSERGMAEVERHNLRLRDRFDSGLRAFDRVTVVSDAPGGHTSPLVSFLLPDGHDSREFMLMMETRHRIIVKQVPQRWFNGIRLSTHVFNTADEVDQTLDVLRVELG